MNYYIYRHLTKDENVPFYVGLGSKLNFKRAYEKIGRNKHWHNTVKKYGYSIEIIASNLTKEEAVELEIFLITLYGRRDLGQGSLVNMTDGGDGRKSSILNHQTKEKISEKLRNRKLSETHKNNLSAARKGIKFSQITKNKLSEAKKGGKQNTKKVIHTQTGIIFNTVQECAAHFNIAEATAIRHLKGRIKNKTLPIKYYEKENM